MAQFAWVWTTNGCREFGSFGRSTVGTGPLSGDCYGEEGWNSRYPGHTSNFDRYCPILGRSAWIATEAQVGILGMQRQQGGRWQALLFPFHL